VSAGHHLPTRGACPRAEVDDIVGARDQREVVLDDDDGRSVIDKPVEQVHQTRGVGEVQAVEAVNVCGVQARGGLSKT